jgi:murein DD-endopeptidase MepM/ murein hydrolase activator NlpD
MIYVLNRYLTPISVGVALLGLVLVIVGPVRDLLIAQGAQAGLAQAGLPGDLLAGGSAGPESAAGLAELERSLAPFTIIPDRPRNNVITYMVQPGDTLFGIAERFGIEPNTLFWANSETLGDSVHMIQSGVELFILPINGIYHKSNGEQSLQSIADQYGADVDAVIASDYNELEGYIPADSPPWGMRLVIPDGYRELVDWRPPIIETTDTATGVVSRSFMPGMGGSCAPGIQGSGGTGAWIPPVAAYAFTQGFFPGHSGVDLAAPVGTAVQAADTGVVIFAGWVNVDWGYGILVVLDHGNGWTTYYAHLSSVGVGCGQLVERGGYIGAVGSTGNSQGPHLHFEMRYNHVPDNPAAYIAF